MTNTNHSSKYGYITSILILLLIIISCRFLEIDSQNTPLLNEQHPQEEMSTSITPTPTTPNTATPNPSTPDLNEAGYTRSNPLPPNQLVKSLNAEFRILEVLRGDEALKLLYIEMPYLPHPSDAQELLLVKLSLKRTGSNEREGWPFFSVPSITGDNLLQRDCVYRSTNGEISSVSTAFNDEALALGEEAEFWIYCDIGAGEGSLMLINEDEEGYEQFIALEPGASISIPDNLASIQPDELGTYIKNPVPFGQKIASEKWEFSIQEIIRGNEAWEILKNEFADPLPPEQEYILIKYQARCISTHLDDCYLLQGFVHTIDRNGVKYENDPDLSITMLDLNELSSTRIRLFPGGEIEIWMPLWGPKNDTTLTAVLRNLWSLGGTDRYFSLNPSP